DSARVLPNGDRSRACNHQNAGTAVKGRFVRDITVTDHLQRARNELAHVARSPLDYLRQSSACDPNARGRNLLRLDLGCIEGADQFFFQRNALLVWTVLLDLDVS